jgi:hypothetical protein
VRGDHDRTLDLPLWREIEVEGKRIVIVHGNRSRWLEEPNTLLWTLSLGYYRPHRGLARGLRLRFPDADAIVFGHTSRRSAGCSSSTQAACTSGTRPPCAGASRKVLAGSNGAGCRWRATLGVSSRPQWASSRSAPTESCRT